MDVTDRDERGAVGVVKGSSREGLSDDFSVIAVVLAVEFVLWVVDKVEGQYVTVTCFVVVVFGNVVGVKVVVVVTAVEVVGNTVCMVVGDFIVDVPTVTVFVPVVVAVIVGFTVPVAAIEVVELVGPSVISNSNPDFSNCLLSACVGAKIWVEKVSVDCDVVDSDFIVTGLGAVGSDVDDTDPDIVVRARAGGCAFGCNCVDEAVLSGDFGVSGIGVILSTRVLVSSTTILFVPLGFFFRFEIFCFFFFGSVSNKISVSLLLSASSPSPL